MFYDGSTINGATPTLGLTTKTTALASVGGGVMTWAQAGRSDFDAYGRATATYDALDRKTSVAYTPATGGPVTATTVTNPMLWTSTTTVEPGHGTPISVVDVNGKTSAGQYDPLGRLTKVWLNNRATTGLPDTQYTYVLSDTAANYVQTQKLGPNGTQVSSYQIYDGQMRLRQTQTPTTSTNGGRLIHDAVYDSLGQTVKTSRFWDSTTAPGGALVTVNDINVPQQHRYTYDTLGRQTVDALWSGNTVGTGMLFQTTNAYDGDRVTTTPPTGGITTRTITNAQGNTTELDQYYYGAPQATTYTYDRLGHQTSITDPVGNTWTTAYDRRGRVTSKSDPDTGTTTLTHDDAGQLLTSTDVRPITLAYTYDALGRTTSRWSGAVGTGTKLADFTFDTVPGALGQAATSSSYTTAGTYTSSINVYDDAYRPLSRTLSIPTSLGITPTSYTTTTSYNIDGSTAAVALPAAGDLPAETLTYGYDNTGPATTQTSPTGRLCRQRHLRPDRCPRQGHLRHRTQPTHPLHRLQRRHRPSHRYLERHRRPQPDVRLVHQVLRPIRLRQRGNLTQKYYLEADNTTNVECFAYIDLRLLTDAWTSTDTACAAGPGSNILGGPDWYWNSWGHDTNTGNRQSQTTRNTAGRTDITYTYPTTHTQPHTLTNTTSTGINAGTTNYLYDPTGNTTTRTINNQTQTLTYTPTDTSAPSQLPPTPPPTPTTPAATASPPKTPPAPPSTSATPKSTTPPPAPPPPATTPTTARPSPPAPTPALTWHATDNHATIDVTINATTLAVTRLEPTPTAPPEPRHPGSPPAASSAAPPTPPV